MKKEIIFKILKKIETNKNFKKKIKVFLFVGIIGIVVISAATAWVGFTAFNYVTSKYTEVRQTSIVQDHVGNLNTELKTISNYQVASCWSKVRSLTAAQSWIERSSMDNLMDLKAACLENSSSSILNSNIQ